MTADVITLPPEPGVDELDLVAGNTEQLKAFRPSDDAGRAMKALNALQLTAYAKRLGRRAHPANR